MSPRTIKLLHVEDDDVKRILVARQLQSMTDLAFRIVVAESEAKALEIFDQGGVGFVMLDYLLEQGNGLETLRQIRQRDRIVPIVVLSGMDSPEIAARLLTAGADDYLGKEGLQTEVLTRSVRDALLRADSWHQRLQPDDSNRDLEGPEQLQALCRSFIAALGSDFLDRVDAFEQTARKSTPEQLQSMFDTVSEQLAAAGEPRARQRLRPLFLELIQRLFTLDAVTTQAASQ